MGDGLEKQKLGNVRVVDVEEQQQAIWNAQQQSGKNLQTISILDSSELPLTGLRRPVEHPYITENIRLDLQEQTYLLNVRILPEGK